MSNLIEELIEIDAHYAGLAYTVAHGGKVIRSDLIDLAGFGKLINLTKVNSDDELVTMNKCKERFEIIVEIDSILRNFCEKNK